MKRPFIEAPVHQKNWDYFPAKIHESCLCWILTSPRDLLAWHQTQKIFYQDWTNCEYLKNLFHQSQTTLSNSSLFSSPSIYFRQLGYLSLLRQSLKCLSLILTHLPSPKEIWRNFPKSIYPLKIVLKEFLPERSKPWKLDRVPPNCLTFQQKTVLLLIDQLLFLHCRARLLLNWRGKNLLLTSLLIPLCTGVSLALSIY